MNPVTNVWAILLASYILQALIFRHPLLASLVTWHTQYLVILKALLETSTRSFCETVVIF